MNLDSLSFALSNISYSVSNLTKKNSKSSVQEISRLVAHHGLEAERHLLRCLFSHVDFSGDGKSSGKDYHQTQFLIQECASILNRPNFVSTFCYAVDCPLQQQKSLRPSVHLLPQLSKVLKLSLVQEIAFGLALLNSSVPEHTNHATNYLKQKLPDFIKYISEQDSSSQEESDIPLVIIHLLLNRIYLKDFEISSEVKTSLKQALLNKFGAKPPVILLPFLTPSTDPVMDSVSNSNKLGEDSIVDVIQEMGYSFTSSVEECRNNMAQIGLRELTPATVAHILSMMSRSHVGLSESVPVQNMNSNSMIMWNDNKEKNEGNQQMSWNVEVFVQVVHDMTPSLDWKEVVTELDNPGFLLKDKKGFKVLWQTLTLGLGHETFPMDRMYRRWRHPDGQFSFFQQALVSSDIMCFTDYPHCPVLTDALKAPPEDDNRSISNWKSLDLIETLLYLSDTPYFKEEVFKFPLSHCPDLLILGLIQSSKSLNTLHKDLLSTLIPVFLGNHPNSAMVFHLVWHVQVNQASVRSIVMHAMADWYMRGECDQQRLSRILDVAQDLKALSMLLNLTPFMFVIDLACLASRREYLKLDKWLGDKVREHGETFIQACVAFLNRRCPQIMGGNIKEENLPKSALPPETLATILSLLHTLVGSVSQELSETILTMVGNCGMVLTKNRLPPPGVVKTSQGLQSVLSSATINAPNTSLDQLTGLTSSVNALSLSNNVKPISSGNSGFPLPGGLSSFSIASSGSPAKMLTAPSSTVAASSVNQIAQNPFPTVMSSVTSQLPAQFSSQLVGDFGAIFPDSSQPISKEIEDEANSYFQRIYNHSPHSSLPIDEVLEMLKRFQDSPVKRERDVFNCMIRNLFEEYRFFPQYPDKELITTAQLFGGIIAENLVSYITLGLALRYVLESLKKPQGSKMFYFGVTAMDRFKTRLKDYPQYCQHLTSIPNFQELPHHLIEYIEYGARSQEPPSRVQGPIMPSLTAAPAFPALTNTPTLPMTTTTVTVTVTTASTKTTLAGKPSIANATNIDTLLVATEKDEKLIVPPENVQDKVAFIVNNLSQSNLAQKTEEFKEIVKQEYWPWAAQYLVMKRASIEPNFHSLYSNFLDTLKQPELTKLVEKETFRNIKVLLRSDKGIANFSDRSLLKNLGHWLGMLTLAKCKPIYQIDIDIKSLLMEAYHNGQQELLYVVPFVAKVLDSCAKSRVFKPPNPWTMAMMNVLAELHQEQDLKLNLKFEIEVLCKSLSIDINDLKPGNVLKDQERALKIEPQLSPLPKHKEQAISSVNLQVPPQTALGAVVPSTPNTMPNNVLREDNLQPSITSSPPATLSTTQLPSLTTTMPQPQFAYSDINVLSTNQLGQHLMVNSQLPLFQNHVTLKACVRHAVERAVQEWIAPVVERSIKISLTTCEQIIKKDFALDPDESRMRIAAHHMVRSLTAGMVMITCRDPLYMSLTTNLRNAFLATLRNATQHQKEMTEHAAEIVARDNLELACCFIQKTAVEKALPEIDKRLSSEYDARKIARNEGRRYCDPMALTYQAERMPEQIRLKVGGVSSAQMGVYEEFARMIPGFLPNGEREQSTNFINKTVAMISPFTDETTQIYDKLISELEILTHNLMPPNNPHVVALHSLIEAVILTRSTREVSSAMALLQKAIDGFLEGMCQAAPDNDIMGRFRDGHLLVLKALADPRVYGHNWTSKQVTRGLIESREECRYNLEAVDLLVRNHLINLQAYDLHLTQSMENGLNPIAVQFAMQLVKLYLVDERQSGIVTEADLFNTVETLARIATLPRQLPDGLSQLLDMLRSSSEPTFLDRAPGGGPMSMMYSGITQAREFDDPPGLYEKTEFLLREWVNMYHSPSAGRDSTKAFSLFVHQMNLQGILKTDELITRFFRLSTEMCVDLCYRVLMDQPLKTPSMVRAKCFHTLDAYVRLIALLVKHSGDANNTITKINLLNKVLGIVTGVLLQDQELRGLEFQQLPYHRIFIMLFLELSAPESVLEAISSQILTAFCNTLYYLRPQKAPGFAYAWLELISHRVFLGRVLAHSPAQKGWTMYAQLLISLFKFLAPFLRNVELAAPIQTLYKGTLRVLLVLLHDFPEFLCDYHYVICDVIAPNCILMRNLILSAFPRNMRLPDPFTPNLKVDLLPEITQAPRILANFNNLIQPASFKKDLDSYIKTRAPVTFLSELRSNLQVSNEPGMRYNIPLINALVLYVGTQAINYIQSKGSTPNMSTITHSSHMDIFQNLAVDLDTEGRYLFLNAIANQLRYPNSHTHYFSCTLLYLFAEANTEAIQEQITRVLLERIIVNRPHPWGLLITFIELIKNQNFKFWNHEFVRCAPEIEKLFENVARSCMHPKPTTEQTNS